MPRLKLDDFVEKKNKLIILVFPQTNLRMLKPTVVNGVWLERHKTLIIYPHEIHESIFSIEKIVGIIDSISKRFDERDCAHYDDCMPPYLRNVVEEIIKKDIPTADKFYSTAIPNEAMEDFIKKGPPNLKKPGYENIVSYRDAHQYFYDECGLTQTGYSRSNNDEILYIN